MSTIVAKYNDTLEAFELFWKHPDNSGYYLAMLNVQRDRIDDACYYLISYGKNRGRVCQYSNCTSVDKWIQLFTKTAIADGVNMESTDEVFEYFNKVQEYTT